MKLVLVIRLPEAEDVILRHRYPRPKHWRAAAFLRGFLRVWPAPKRLHRWAADNSLRLPR